MPTPASDTFPRLRGVTHRIVALAIAGSVVTPLQSAIAQTPVFVRGHVTDSAAQPIDGATIRVAQSAHSSTSSASGEFRLALPPGSWRLRITALGYQPVDTATHVPPDGDVIVDVVLVRAAVTLSNLVIPTSPSPPLGLAIPRETMDAVPRVGEADVFRALQAAAGVNQPNDLKGRVHIAGGSGDETGVRLDGFPLDNPFHALGVLGAFNVDAIDEAVVHLHHQPAEYDGALSGTIDLRSRREAAGNALNVGLLAASTSLGATLPGTPLQARVSARITYLDRLAEALIASSRLLAGDITLLGFRDATAVLTLPRTDHGLEASVIGFASQDYRRARSAEGLESAPLEWGEVLIGSTIGLTRGRWHADAKLSVGAADVRQSENDAAATFVDVHRRTMFAAATSEGVVPVGVLRLGLTSTHRVFDQRWRLQGNPSTVFTLGTPRAFNGRESLSQANFFASWRVPIAGRAGLTLDSRLAVAEGERLWLPSLTAHFRASDAIRLESVLERRSQFIAELEEPREGSITSPIFVLARARRATIAALQVRYAPVRQARGVLRGAHASLFTKVYPNRPVLAFVTEGSQAATPSDLSVASVRGRVSGVVTSVGVHGFATHIQAAYTYQRARDEVGGVWAPTAWDAPHSISVLAASKLRERLMAHAIFVRRSGAATTPVAARIFVPDPFAPNLAAGRYIYADRNSARLPAYQRVDLDLTYTWRARGIEWSARGGVLNLLARANPIEYDWNAFFCARAGVCSTTEGTRKGLPTLPTISISARW